MGVSISMRGGTVMRSKSEPVDITPGLRSRAASVLEAYFGSSPMEIDQDHLRTLETLADGAAVYETNNIWRTIIAGVRDYECVTIALEW
jgi:hypothetical protein